MCCSGQNQTTTKTSLSPTVQSAYDTAMQQYLSQGQKEYTPYAGERVAGFSDDQNSAFANVRNAQGLGQPYVNQAGQMTQQGAAPLTTADIQARYNPAIQSQVDALQADLGHQNAMTLDASNSNAAKLGALTGNRSPIAAQIAQDPANRDAAMATSQLRSNAFNQASNLAQQDQSRMLQAGQQYAGLGSQAQNMATQDAQTLFASGGLQQQYGQAVNDANYQEHLNEQAYGPAMAAFLGQGVGSLGSQYGTSTTTTVPKPSIWSQIAGLGATAAGAYMGMAKDGGRIERAEGGGLGNPTINIQGAGQQGGGLPPPDPEFAQLTSNLGAAIQAFKGHMNGGAVVSSPAAGGNATDYGYAPGGAVTRSMAPPPYIDPSEDWSERTQRLAGVMQEPEDQSGLRLPMHESAMPVWDGLYEGGIVSPDPHEFAVGGGVETQGDYWKLNPGKIAVADPQAQTPFDGLKIGGGGRAPSNSHQSVPQGSGGDLGLGALGASIGRYYGSPAEPNAAESLAGGSGWGAQTYDASGNMMAADGGRIYDGDRTPGDPEYEAYLDDLGMRRGDDGRLLMPLPTQSDIMADKLLFGGGKHAKPHSDSPYGLVPGLQRGPAHEAAHRNDGFIDRAHDYLFPGPARRFAVGGVAEDEGLGRSFALDGGDLGGSEVPGISVGSLGATAQTPFDTALASPPPEIGFEGAAPSDLNPTGGVGVAPSPYTEDSRVAPTQPTTVDDGSYYETNPWLSVMAGGAATMAGDSPYAGINIGRGIAGGLSTYFRGLQQDREARATDRAASRAADKLAYEMEQQRQRMGLDERRIGEYERHNRAMEGKGSDAEQAIQMRIKAVTERGKDPNEEPWLSYTLTGKMPREDAQPYTATDKKFIAEADDQVLGSSNAITNFDKALDINANKETNQGPLAYSRAYLGSIVPDALMPDSISSPESSTNTLNLDNIVTANALASMKSIFGANPTEGERQILLEIQGSSNLPREVREDIYRRARAMAETRLAKAKQQGDELRGQTYYKPGGGAAASPTPQRPPNVPEGSQYSPSRKQWRAPEGQMFNADGSPVNG